MMLPYQKRILFFLVLDVIILVIFIWLAAFPLFGEVRNASQELLLNQKTLVNLDWREPLTKELEKKYQERQTELLALDEAFLNTTEAVGFISTLERIAQETGNIFEIKTVKSFAPSIEEETFLIFRITLLGDFSSLLLFLANLEDNPYPPYRLIEIESLTIRRIGGRGLTLEPKMKEGDLETTLGVKIYTQ